MSEQPPLLKHLNKRLFADYFLNERVPHMDGWQDALEQAANVQKQLRTLREKVNPNNSDEAQLEQLWIRPVFAHLGLSYALQVKFRKGDKGYIKPDYVFTRNPEDATAIGNDIYTSDQLRHTLAVADAKRWGISLDNTHRNSPAQPKERNPAQQIDEYLRYSERPWGVLTNGKYWRLYHRDSSKNNVFYAVDLDALLSSDANAFNYFYAFFRLEAFTSGFLQRVLAQSQDFAQKVTDDLEQQVYDALTEIAQGFIDYRPNELATTPETLNEIYQASLVLLYRLLFIFYAESRQILPLEHEPYRVTRSMDSLKKDIANKRKQTSNYPFDPDDSSIYGRLKGLFVAIDRGNPNYRVPAYNGKLFSDTEHPFLKTYAVGDAHLAPALDKLSRVTVKDERGNFTPAFVDYRDLDVRHLGSIYEKLLDYELDLATEDLTENKKGQFIAAKAGEAVIVSAGKVFLRTGSFERKTTGSYYTPDYIVRFIVEKTLEPLLTAITEKHAARAEGSTWQVDDAPALVHEVLSLNILDPATGSGHFAVDAVSYIAEWLTALAITPQDAQLDAGDAESGEDELIIWKRLVASACIYAVDSNPLAVELAKLSLWLTTLARGKPLSFLDHHIRVGNSLVGAKVSALTSDLSALENRQKRQAALKEAAAKGQVSMFGDDDLADGVRTATSMMRDIESTIASSVADVKKQEQLYAQLTERLNHWQQAADVWTAKVYGLLVSESDWRNVWQQATTGKTVPEAADIIRQAQQLAHEQHFFHWELAFPEVFFDADGKPKADPGFDAVIGNPPYVRMESIKPLKEFLRAMYEVHESRADLFLYFYELGIKMLKRKHRLGYITSGTYMNSNSAKPFRKYLHEHAGMEWVANFGENQPFRGAEMVYPTIAVMRKESRDKTFKHLFFEGNIPFESLEKTLNTEEWGESLSATTKMAEWRFQAAELTLLFDKVTKSKVTLNEVVSGHTYSGVKTGLNDAFVIDESTKDALVSLDPSSNKIIKPMVRGQDLRPWVQQQSLYLVFAHHGFNIGDFSGIKHHLSAFKEQLAARATIHAHHWYELQQPQMGIFSLFEKPKIFWAEIAKLPRFSWDTSGLYMTNKVHFVSTEDIFLLALLNSRVSWFILSQLCVPLRLRGGLWQYQLTHQFVKRLPIPELSAEQETTLAELAEAITKDAQKRYQLHENMRQTIVSDFRGEPLSSRVALYRWWELEDEKALSDEIQKRFGQEIPLKQRSQWREFLKDQKAQHDKLTQDIIKNEITLNGVVYDAFGLDEAERKLVEETTKYKYGEV